MANRHQDFEYILGEFNRYYCKGEAECPKAMSEYNAWLKALKLNDSKSYGQARESFQWAKDMISRFKEDASNVYYKVLVGFPTKSMNRNVYKERDLVAAAHTLVGKHPSINHKDEYRLSPANPHNRWGVVTVVAAAPEDGAVEAILQVPKTAKCPVCNGALLTELIDAKRIYNVSLEGACNGHDHEGNCDGFEFTENGFSLLTTDVLPGIPMTKIFPLESFMFIEPKHSKSAQAIRIVGLKTTRTEGELSGLTNPDQTVKVVQPDDNGKCPEGTMWSSRVNGCVNIDDGTASTMFDTSAGGNKAGSDLRKPRAGTGRQQFTPEGTKVVLDQGGSSQKWHTTGPWNETDDRMNDSIPNQAMGNPAGCRQSDVGVQSQDMPGGGKLSKGLSGDMLNAMHEGWGDSSFPDSSFMWVPENAKGANGNKSDRKLPVKTADGKWDLPHVRNALARLGQTQGIPEATKSKIKATLQRVLSNQPAGECTMAGDMAKLQGKTNVMLDQGGNDKYHPDNDDQWLIEKGGVGTFDADKARLDGAPSGGSVMDRPGSTTRYDNQPAHVGHDACPNGMVWSDSDGMCVYDDPGNEGAGYNPTGPCRKNEAWDASRGGCVAVEGPNIKDEPDSADDTGHPPVPPIDQPTSTGIIYKQCPDGYVYDPDTGMCGFDAAQTEAGAKAQGPCPPGMKLDPETGLCAPPMETIKHGDARHLSDVDDGGHNTSTLKQYNPGTPGSNVKHGNPADARAADSCRDGMVWDSRKGMCVVASDQNEDIGKTDNAGMTPKINPIITNSPGQDQCKDGLVWNAKLGMCVPTDDAGGSGDQTDRPNIMAPSHSQECKPAGNMGDLQGKTNTMLDQGGVDKWHPDNDDKWLIERMREAQALIESRPESAPYSYDDCIGDQMNQYGDMEAAKTVCSRVKYKQGATYHGNHELELSAALSKAAELEAQISQMHIAYDAQLKGQKALVAQHWNAYQTEKDARLKLEGRLKAMSERMDAQDDKSRLSANERVEVETRLARRERDFQEAQEGAGRFKKLYEELQQGHAQTEDKYREALKTNLALNRQITKGNEDYLILAREKEAIEEKLKNAQRLAKHIVVKTRI